MTRTLSPADTILLMSQKRAWVLARWFDPVQTTLQTHHTDVKRCPCPDYIFGDRKFGGNAQAITRQRWLHHTSFLWDFRDDRMALLQHPEKTPEYRAVHSQTNYVFVCLYFCLS